MSCGYDVGLMGKGGVREVTALRLFSMFVNDSPVDC